MQTDESSQPPARANIEALKQLRRVVAEAPSPRFDMSVFQNDGEVVKGVPQYKQEPCGTKHCAAGWAALDPWHQANTTINTVFPVVNQLLGIIDTEAFYGTTTRILYQRLGDIYGISEEDAEGIFLLPDTKTRFFAALDDLIARG